jgi:hypothetical protein
MMSPYQVDQDARFINWMVSARSDQEWITIHSQPRVQPFRLWVDPAGAVGEPLEQFLGRVTGFLLDSHAAQVNLMVWSGGAWVQVRDAVGLRRLLAWLGTFPAGLKIVPPPMEAGERNPPCRLTPQTLLAATTGDRRQIFQGSNHGIGTSLPNS